MFQMQCLWDILGLTLWDRQRNIDVMKQAGEVPVEKELKQRRWQWLSQVWWMPDHCTKEHLLRCRPQWKRTRPGETPLHWFDVVSRDQVGYPTVKSTNVYSRVCGCV